MNAALDVGSNTIRLLLGEVMSGRVVPRRYLRQITRLGGGYRAESGIAQDAAERTLQALEAFSEVLESESPAQVRAVATEAVRRACNAEGFIKTIAERTGIRLEILDGEEEAWLSACGVLSALDPVPSSCLIFDIGGGSTEFIYVQNGQSMFHKSYPLGVVSLAECELPMDKICQQVAQLQTDLGTVGLIRHASSQTCELVGTAGTVTTLAAVDMELATYDWRRVNNYVLPLTRIAKMKQRFTAMTPSEREAVAGMEKGRGDLIVHGMEIVMLLMKSFQKDRLRVSDFGLLEGVLLSIG